MPALDLLIRRSLMDLDIQASKSIEQSGRGTRIRLHKVLVSGYVLEAGAYRCTAQAFKPQTKTAVHAICSPYR